MSAPCTCEPGSEENGWHETRCPLCEAAELQQWVKAMETGRKIAQQMREERSA